ncbi:hypothetical protein D3C75_1336410 [compost metagenome]
MSIKGTMMEFTRNNVMYSSDIPINEPSPPLTINTAMTISVRMMMDIGVVSSKVMLM